MVIRPDDMQLTEAIGPEVEIDDSIHRAVLVSFNRKARPTGYGVATSVVTPEPNQEPQYRDLKTFKVSDVTLAWRAFADLVCSLAEVAEGRWPGSA